MEKISKINISKAEMKELKGGASAVAGVSASGDTQNTNKVSTCICTWNDHSVIINDNRVQGCKCTCLLNAMTPASNTSLLVKVNI